MTSPKVSVVLTTYNRAHVVRETIQAVLGQTHRDFELIVSDDASTDATAEIVRAAAKSDARVRYRRNATNLGMPGNLNAAVRDATGHYIANLHDGDVYDPSLLERWLSALEACPRAAFVFNACRSLDPSGTEDRVFREDLPPCFDGSLLLEKLYFRRWRFASPVWGTVMARRHAYEEAGYFQERFGFCSDVDMWLRLAERHHVAYVNEPLISLPSYDVLPRHDRESRSRQLRLVERMFWESRMRYYANRPFRRAAEAARHVGFVALDRAYETALRARRGVLRRV